MPIEKLFLMIDKDKHIKILFSLWIGYYLIMMMVGIIIPKKSPITLGFNIMTFIYLAYFNIIINKEYTPFRYIYVWSSFILIMILYSSSAGYASCRMWMKYAMALLCLPAGFVLFDTQSRIVKFSKLLYACVLLFCINFIIANVLHLGGSRYGVENGIDTGNLFDNALYTNVIALIFTPILFEDRKNIAYKITILCICIIITIVCFKRTVIACLFAVAVIYIVGTYYIKYKYGETNEEPILSKKIKTLALVAIFAVSTFFYPIFLNQLAAREERLNANVESEGRVQEFIYICDDILQTDDLQKCLLGKETFNTVGTYAHGLFGNRMIHEDYGIVLNGLGVIGFIFLIYVNFKPLFIYRRYYLDGYLEDNSTSRCMILCFLSVWFTYIFATFSGSIWQGFFPQIAFAAMGVCIRFFYEEGNIFESETEE